MKLQQRIAETTDWSNTARQLGYQIGLVPTMGALHSGHLSLVKRAKDENQRVAVSIFVNPIQFNNASDLLKYPRNLDQDLQLLASVLEEEDVVFAPSEAEMYPENVTKKYQFGDLEMVMEGAHRPGHFNGVGVVVDLLFRIVAPHRAYFGEKDFQQLAIIRELTRMEQHPIDIIPCAIKRENDGLAMSSRNVRLEKAIRKNSSHIYQELQAARIQIQKGTALEEIRQSIENNLNRLPGFRVEYVCFADENTLRPLETATNSRFRCFIAVFAGEVRLIDNLPMN